LVGTAVTLPPFSAKSNFLQPAVVLRVMKKASVYPAVVYKVVFSTKVLLKSIAPKHPSALLGLPTISIVKVFNPWETSLSLTSVSKVYPSEPGMT
jgi:hypothetical protein